MRDKSSLNISKPNVNDTIFSVTSYPIMLTSNYPYFKAICKKNEDGRRFKKENTSLPLTEAKEITSKLKILTSNMKLNWSKK